MHFNGSVNVQNNGLVVTNGAITVQGTATGPLTNYTPDPTTGQPGITDPFADYVARPDYSALAAKTYPCGTGSTHGPGIYASRNFPNGTCTLQPGLYVVTGLWDMSGTTTVTGAGVTLFFTCATAGVPRACGTGEEGGTIDASGNGILSITAPTRTPTRGWPCGTTARTPPRSG